MVLLSNLDTESYILLDVFLSMPEGSLAKLRGQLGRWVIHELSVLPKHIPTRRRRSLRLLVWVAIVLRLWL